MPIYEFECRNCGKVFETLILSGNPKHIHCPACSGQKVARIMSTFSCLGVQLTKKFKMEAEEGLKREKI